MKLSTINRARFTAWAWLGAAFLVGGAVGGAATGVPLLQQLNGAKQALARQQYREQLADGTARRPGEEALAEVGTTSAAAPAFVHKAAAPDAIAVASAPPQAALEAPVPAAPEAIERRPVAAAPQQVAAVKTIAQPEPVAKVAAPAPAPAPAKAAARVVAKVKAPPPVAQPAKAARQEDAKGEGEQLAAARAGEAQRAAEPEDSARVANTLSPKGSVTAPAGPATNAPTQRVTKDEAGLTEIQTSGVSFKSGRRVAVGESFPSGERLVSVDPVIGEIITTKRRIVVKPASATPP